MRNLTVNDVAKALNKSPQYIRICLQKGLLPFGTAAKESVRNFVSMG